MTLRDVSSLYGHQRRRGSFLIGDRLLCGSRTISRVVIFVIADGDTASSVRSFLDHTCDLTSNSTLLRHRCQTRQVLQTLLLRPNTINTVMMVGLSYNTFKVS